MKILICAFQRYESNVDEQQYDVNITDDCNISTLNWLCNQLINGAEVWKVNGHWQTGDITKVEFPQKDYSVESVMIHAFNIITPQNAALSRLIVHYMDQVDLGKMQRSDLEDKMDYYISISSCDLQKGLLKDIKSNFGNFFG